MFRNDHNCNCSCFHIIICCPSIFRLSDERRNSNNALRLDIFLKKSDFKKFPLSLTVFSQIGCCVNTLHCVICPETAKLSLAMSDFW